MTLHERLRRMAARLCSASAMERVIDPVVTDIEFEYHAAIAEGRRWRSRWIRIAGCFALVKAVALCAYDRTAHDWRADDRRTLARTVGISAIAFAVTALLLIAPAAAPTPAYLLLYLIPQALPLAIPVGVTWGILCGLGSRAVAFRVKGAILALAFGCSAASLVTMLWLMPAANQAFRVSVLEHLGDQGKAATLARGVNEMPIGELRRRVHSPAQSVPDLTARTWAYGYYLRWSLPWAPLALALFALTVVTRPFARGWVLAAAASGTCLAYYLLLFTAAVGTRDTQLPVVALAWLPNLACLAAATASLVTAARPGRRANY